jgi:spermidine/putrescine transport system substrate-binding protein
MNCGPAKFLIQQFGTGHSNKKAFDRVPPEKLAEIGASNPAELMRRSNFLRELAPDRRAKYNDMFNAIKAGG